MATRWCIARALRRVSNSERLCQHIQEMISAQDRLSREVAVEISGWQSPGFMQNTLQMLAQEDFSGTISQKALEALQHQEEQRWVAELMEEFRTDSTSRRWNLLMSIIQLGDPFLLVDSRDRLWIGQIFAETWAEHWDFAKQEIRRRKQLVLDNARRLDQKK
jgi:hypothetical protein